MVSIFTFIKTPRNIDAEFGQSNIKTLADTGLAIGPITLQFEPNINVPETVKLGQAFPIEVSMNLVGASPIKISEVPSVLPELGNALQLRLLLGGADFQPEGWQAAGSDLVFEWSVVVDEGGHHVGSIEKRFVVNDTMASRSEDQMPFDVSVDDAFAAWKEAWGLVTGLLGILMATGSFYFSWREHQRKEQALQS